MGDLLPSYVAGAVLAALVLGYLHLMSGIPLRRQRQLFLSRLRQRLAETILSVAVLAFNLFAVWVHLFA